MLERQQCLSLTDIKTPDIVRYEYLTLEDFYWTSVAVTLGITEICSCLAGTSIPAFIFGCHLVQSDVSFCSLSQYTKTVTVEQRNDVSVLSAYVTMGKVSYLLLTVKPAE